VTAAAFLLPLAARDGFAAAPDDQTKERALVALLQKWAQGGPAGAAVLSYVEQDRPESATLAWRLLRVEARQSGVRLLCVASRATAARGCRIVRRGRIEDRTAVASILSGGARVLALPPDKSRSGKGNAMRRTLMFSDGKCEMSRASSGVPLAGSARLFAQLSALMKRVIERGQPAAQEAGGGDSIGGATMLSNGALQLWLRAESSVGDLGDAQFLVAPTDDDYAGYLVQLGGLCPGDEVSVPPWPNCDR
jgi:hypothetical protein